MLVSAPQKALNQHWWRIPEGSLRQESQEISPVFSFPLDVPFPSFCLFYRVPLPLSCSPLSSFLCALKRLHLKSASQFNPSELQNNPIKEVVGPYSTQSETKAPKNISHLSKVTQVPKLYRGIRRVSSLGPIILSQEEHSGT